ncbi:hypothetical protein QEH56_10865 [Pelagicoccus enzymogenes]|nr:hypothetical protein [Pelagicoccus enzymogenes]
MHNNTDMQKKYILALLSLLLISCSQPKDPKTEAAEHSSAASHALKGHNYMLAEQYSLKATDLQPEVPEYWTGLGMAQASQEKNDEAKASYEKAISILKSEDQQRYEDQAYILLLLGRKEEAALAVEAYNKQTRQTLNVSNLSDEESERFKVK